MNHRIFLILFLINSSLMANDSFLNIFNKEENVFFKKLQYKKLLLSLNDNIKNNNEPRNFFTGFLLYKRGKHEDAFLFFKSLKDKNLKAFGDYYMARYYFNHNKIKQAEKLFNKIDKRHYFENSILLYQSKIYFKKNNLEKFEKIYSELFKLSKKKQKQEIQKLYITLLYKIYIKENRKLKYNKKEQKEEIKSNIQKYKNKLKTQILIFLNLNSLANTPWLKTYVKKIFRTEEDYFNLLLKRYYYLIAKFRYIKALNIIDSDIRRYERYRIRAKRKHRQKLLMYKNRLYLLKIEILYKLRRYKKTFTIFEKILKYKQVKYSYWLFKVYAKRNMLKKYEAYYKKTYSLISHSEYIEEIDYLRAMLNFNNHKLETEKLFHNFFKKYKISNKILEMQEKLAWFYYREGLYSKSIPLYEIISKNQNYKKRDLAYYWLGKIYKKIGLNKKGEAYWQKILINSPLTYYSNLVLNYSNNSFNKVTLSNRKQLNKKLNVRNFQKIIKNDEIPNYIRFFIKYRFYNIARYELFYLYKRNNRKLNHNLKLAMAKLSYLNEKSIKYAHAIFHRDMGGADYPENDSLEIWQLAFPNMYKNDVLFASKTIKIPKSLIYAIIREESSFNRLAKSYSNAYGLMQLLYPTARRLRWSLKAYTRLNFNRSWKLFNSRYNISLGTTYLKFLDKEFNGNKISMIASYNAGERNVRKWRKKYKNMSEDEFVESIPINQTKHYVKKVLKSYYIYKYIYNFKTELNYIPIKKKLKARRCIVRRRKK